MNWSGGKDSALSLYKILQDQRYSVDRLLTNVNAVHDRISMHGIRRELLIQQAASIGIELTTIELPENPGMNEYERIMTEKLSALKNNNYTTAIFGDIFLEDLKNYREKQLSTLGINCVFPLWKTSTRELMNEFLSLGFKAVIVCVNEQYLDKSFCGRLIDASFIRDLPPEVDICGENGEYHSFVFDGPVFKTPINFKIGEIVRRTYPAPSNNDRNCYQSTTPVQYGFYFCDLVP
ncbi:MAG: diphthine--ammonia ligase [Chitinophagaceae bacterium]|nr:diphthine--ammonia ligase [Chitinophagaceae bacterium]